MKFEPYAYQKAAIQWILDRPASALFLSMGMGKTVCTLTAVNEWLFDSLEADKVLVIAPLRPARDTWAAETQKWDHLKHLRISKILGDTNSRRRALYADADIYVINRENVVWLTEELGREWFFDTVIIDELSSFKSTKARRFRAMKRIRKKIHRLVGLTGTPAPKGLLDLWPQVYLLDQGERLGKTVTAYREQYFIPEKQNGHIVYSYRLKEGAEQKIYDAIGDICMSLNKEDYLDLPGQIYNYIQLELDESLMKQYKQFERDQVLQAMDGGCAIVAANAAGLTNKLLQFAAGAVYDENKNVRLIHDIKLDALEDLVESANGQPVLIFYNYKHDAERIKDRIRCRRLDKAQDIEDWNAQKIPVAIAHPASVGHGLNLQYGGHIIVWFDLTWDLELYQQANERLNRPGQKEVCVIHHLIVKGTHDERVLESLEKKDGNQNNLIKALEQVVEDVVHGG